MKVDVGMKDEEGYRKSNKICLLKEGDKEAIGHSKMPFRTKISPQGRQHPPSSTALFPRCSTGPVYENAGSRETACSASLSYASSVTMDAN